MTEELSPVELEHHGGLVHLLSAPEGSLFWAVGMRHELQIAADGPALDQDYVSHCLKLLRRSGAWRLLRNGRGDPFRSFIQFCTTPRPHGLGLPRGEVQALLAA